jgi:hypothetical protein
VYDVEAKVKSKNQNQNLVVWVAVERVDWIDQTEDSLTPCMEKDTYLAF